MSLSALSCGQTATSPSCPSLDSYCSQQSVTCVRDWATAQRPSTWCPDGGFTASPRISIFTGCGGFNMVWVTGVDTGALYLYDAASGQLVGVGSVSSGACFAGDVPATARSNSCDDGGTPAGCSVTGS
jgi:hypothetical protein